MKQTLCGMRYLATILISVTMIGGGLDFSKTDLQTGVSARVSKEKALSSNLPVYFEENKGQFDKKVRYFTRGTSGYSMFLTATETVYVLSSEEPKTVRRTSSIPVPKAPTANFETERQSKGVAVYKTLLGANEYSEWSGLELLEHRTNYFKGSDESKWQTDVPNYQRVRANHVYEGIDMIWHGKEKGDVQYDFVVQPNANPNQIVWEIKGAGNVELTAEGDLLIRTEYGDIKQNRPFTYQETNGFRVEVESSFILEPITASGDNTENSFRIKFQIGDYSPDQPLIIDPTINLSSLGFSTFLGGSNLDYGFAIAVDSAGSAYVTGQTRSALFPTTAGTFDTTHNGFDDVFVTKLNPTGSSLIYSTFLGGGQFDQARAIAVDSSGNAYVTGNTELAEIAYPTTVGAFDTTHNGTNDVFVTKLNATGSALVYSTFLGGLFVDYGEAIAVDLSGNAYVTGPTYYEGEPAFPTTIGAFDTTPNGDYDVFVTKLNATGSALIYSTLIGGTSYDVCDGIAIDALGNAFLTGHTNSADYPTTPDAYDTTYNINIDVFVTKLNPDGSALTYSTYIGGNAPDIGQGIAVDSSGNAFVVGYTFGSDYPTTPGAYDTTHNHGINDVFVTKFNSEGSALVYSTFLGGGGDDRGFAIAIDSMGSAVLTGRTASSNFPTTPRAYDIGFNGIEDAFVTKLNPAGSALNYSSFLGGSSIDNGRSIAIDTSGNAYLTGETSAGTADYPTTAGAFDTTHNGTNDVFVTKLDVSKTLSAPFDFDGDGKTDAGIFRPGLGEWWLLRSTAGPIALQFGVGTDVIAPGDYTGDGKADVAFFRPSTGEWFILRSEDFSYFSFPFGTAGDVPATGDYDGDGKSDVAVFRPSTGEWYILRSSDGGVTILQWGLPGDVPVTADYDGDGKDDIAIFRPSAGEWWLLRSTDGAIALRFGEAGDRALPGDYTGDGKGDTAFWRPSTGEWFILRSEDFSYFSFPFGTAGDVPATGDYDGDGLIDPAVFRPASGTWFVLRSTAGTQIFNWGLDGDRPVPGAFVR